MYGTLQNAVFAVPENPIMRGVRGLGATGAGNGYAFGQPISFSSGANAPTGVQNAMQVSPFGGGTYGTVGSGAGQCPMQPDGSCLVNGQSVACSQIRECDSITGATHFEWTLPSGAAKNADICSIDPLTGAGIWLDSSGNPGAPPPGVNCAGGYPIPSALVPAPPTSVTIPRAAIALPAPTMPSASNSSRRVSCGAGAPTGGDGMNWLAIAAAFAVGYLVTR
jgi:hypothetical protein